MNPIERTTILAELKLPEKNHTNRSDCNRLSSMMPDSQQEKAASTSNQ